MEGKDVMAKINKLELDSELRNKLKGTGAALF
jgi:hypothetical protein